LWRINSADGHQVQGSFGFGVRADPLEFGRHRTAQVLRST
jgi:hypothetical protein